MQHYHNLLYVSHATSDDTEGLKQALSLARNNDAPLSVLVMKPKFPKEFSEYHEHYESALLAEVGASIAASKKAIKLEEGAVETKIELITDNTPAVTIIQHVLQNGYDLVIKEAEPREQKTGFKAVDMELLRKCPVPVWLCRPISLSRSEMKVAVAIDPESTEPAAKVLSKRMLELSRSLADSCSGTLNIISCWDYMFEDYLRGNAWVKASESEIAGAVHSEQRAHRASLDALIEDANLSGGQEVHHLRGSPEEQIPQFVEKHAIDVLVMGTLARTGIQGFIIGNTAENTVQRLHCSLMALKPQGFISPVKAY